jgi:hypothetical protein
MLDMRVNLRCAHSGLNKTRSRRSGGYGRPPQLVSSQATPLRFGRGSAWLFARPDQLTGDREHGGAPPALS